MHSSEVPFTGERLLDLRSLRPGCWFGVCARALPMPGLPQRSNPMLRRGCGLNERRVRQPARSYWKSPAGNRSRGSSSRAFTLAAVWISRHTVAVLRASTTILPRPAKVTCSPGASTVSSRRPLAVTHSLPVTQKMRHALPLGRSEASAPRARTNVDGFISSQLRILLSSWDQ